MQGQEKTNWMMVIPLGIVYFIVYYVLFHFSDLEIDIKTPGREEEPAQEYEEEPEYEYREDFSEELLAKIAAGLGGKKNIGDIDCCVTRLRCGLKDISLVMMHDQRNRIKGNSETRKQHSDHLWSIM